MKSEVLFIVYYLPPMGAGGVQRPLKFIKYLSRFGWHPLVLAPEPGAYHTFDNSLADELDRSEATVVRVKADTPFHKWSSAVSIIDKFPEGVKRWIRKMSYGLMLPDNKKGWIEPALQKANHLLNDHNIELIFSTAPPYSNHLIAAELKKETGLPVIMDLRDDWLESQLIEYPTRWHKRRMEQLEKDTIREADALTVLDDFMKQRLHDRYGEELPACHILPHGFDPEDFNNPGDATLKYKKGKLNLLHSGTFNHANQPDPFLHLVHRLLRNMPEMKERLALHFQGGLTTRHHHLIEKLNLTECVVDYGYLPHDKAVANINKSDALWLISDYGREHKQATSGKLFEYIGSGKPIFGLIFKGGEEERLLERYEASYVAQPDDPDEGIGQLINLFEDWQNNSTPEPDLRWSGQFDRINLTRQLADLFDTLVPVI